MTTERPDPDEEPPATDRRWARPYTDPWSDVVGVLELGAAAPSTSEKFAEEVFDDLISPTSGTDDLAQWSVVIFGCHVDHSLPHDCFRNGKLAFKVLHPDLPDPR
jgi:hypothetical protein